MDCLQGKKVLIIDDDPVVRFLAQKILESRCHVIQAQDGIEGLRQFTSTNPDLVILDIMMPSMNGWQTLISIRHLSKTPVLMLSSENHAEDIQKSLDLGANDYLIKPINPWALLAHLRAVCT